MFVWFRRGWRVDSHRHGRFTVLPRSGDFERTPSERRCWCLGSGRCLLHSLSKWKPYLMIFWDIGEFVLFQFSYLLTQPMANAKEALTRRDNNSSSSTRRCWSNTIKFYWYRDESDDKIVFETWSRSSCLLRYCNSWTSFGQLSPQSRRLHDLVSSWKSVVASPRMNAPYACGNFHACVFTRFQKPQQLGRVRIACSSIVTPRAQRARPNLSDQRCCKLRLKLLARKTRKLFIEFVTAKRLVCKNGHSLVEPPSRVFFTVAVSVCLFVGERFF